MIERKVTFHSAASATAPGTVHNCAGLNSLVAQISGTFSATVTWQGSVDETNYIAIAALNLNSGAVATTATAAGLYLLNVAGLKRLRANLTWSSGTSITVTGLGVDGPAVDVARALTGVTVAAVTMPTAIVHGQKTVAAAGTEEALGSSTALAYGVRIKALAANTGWVYVGANPVTSSTGFVLDAGEEVFLEVANLATVYIDVSVNGEGVSYIGG